MALLDILACPVCHGPLRAEGSGLDCEGCSASYPILDGVPVLLDGAEAGDIEHEYELCGIEYFAGAMKMLEGLPADQIVLDIGAGRCPIDDPRIVLLDVVWTPTVDVIGDAQALPLRDEVVTCVFSTAVTEHLPRPAQAAEEIWRVLRTGGQVFTDCNFVFPFHGFPAVYFNASVQGLRQLYARFHELEASSAPWQGPSYAVQALLGEYLSFFDPQLPIEREFVDAVRALGRFPLQEFDRRFTREQRERIAAGVYYLGLKQETGEESTVPPPALECWRNDPTLRARYPNPGAIMPCLVDGVPDTLWRWTVAEGRREHAEIAAWLERTTPFQK